MVVKSEKHLIIPILSDVLKLKNLNQWVNVPNLKLSQTKGYAICLSLIAGLWWQCSSSAQENSKSRFYHSVLNSNADNVILS